MALLSTLAVDAVVKILSFLDGRTLAMVTRSLLTTTITTTTTTTTLASFLPPLVLLLHLP
jgi:hypothetical protein